MMPFPGGIEDIQNGTLILSVAAAFLYLLIVNGPVSWRRTAAKTGSIALLAVLAFNGGAPWLLVAALALSALGDATLAQEAGVIAHDLTPTPDPSPQGGGGFAASSPGAEPHKASDGEQVDKSPSSSWGEGDERCFLAGLGAFLVAQLAYAVLFLQVGDGAGAYADPWHVVAGAAVVLLAGLLMARLWAAVGGAPRFGVMVYGAVLAAMVLAALTVPSLAVIAGALLFLVSDALLAWSRFLDGPGKIAPAIWISYYAAQLAIVLGFLLS